MLFGGHCDLYIMVQRFCLVSLTISNRKTSYRSLKQTAGSTSCPWTTILVPLKPVLWGVAGVAHFITGREQTQ